MVHFLQDQRQLGVQTLLSIFARGECELMLQMCTSEVTHVHPEGLQEMKPRTGREAAVGVG